MNVGGRGRNQATSSARRGFLLGALAAITTHAWAAPVKRIGVLVHGSEEQGLDIVAVLANALRPHGWREGVNLEFVLVAAGGNPTPEDAAALLRRGVDVVFTANNIPAQLLKQATTTVPIVAIVGDPVRHGFANSLARPGGNFTGLAFSLRDVQLKSLELARAFIPGLSRFRLFSSEAEEPLDSRHSLVSETRHMGVAVERVKVLSLADLAQRFKGASITERGAAFITLPFMTFESKQVAELAIARRVATFSPYKEEVRDGFLASYSKDFSDEMARVAAAVDKILRGMKPAEIPFEEPTQTYIAINKRTAAALGLAIPPDMLLRADEVIS